QSRAKGVPVSDLLLHALTKIYVTGELRLLDREAVANYLDRVTTIALRICSTDDRDRLRHDINVMRMSGDTSIRGDIPIVHIPALSGQTPPAEDEGQANKRFSLIFDRLTREMESGSRGAAPAEPQALAQL